MSETRINDSYSSEGIPIDVYVVRSLDGNSYDTGKIEAIDCELSKTCEAFGRLISLLYDKGIISLPEVSIVVVGYDADLKLVNEG